MKKFIVWGCRLHQHTNSYVYAGYFKAAKAMGLDAHWLYPDSDVSGMDFADSLFLTEGQHNGNIPIRDDCTYVLHNCVGQPWDSLKRRLVLQTYTDDAPRKWGAKAMDGFPGSYTIGDGIWQPWATDLLPHEIDLASADLPRSNEIHWVGTMGGGRFGNENEINPFKDAAIANGCSWHYHGPGSTSFDQNRELIQRSFLAPTITGQWQTEVGYIPCRIFKNSSYGHLMATNSKACHDLLDGHGVYSLDTRELFHKARAAMGDKDMIRNAMKLIKEKHTFVNRINAILSLMK